jgi:MoxR-like ATPase
VTIGDETLPLPDPFFVMATQNPVELEGTYPLPEAQIDRFLVKLVVAYPSEEEEREIVARDAAEPTAVRPALGPDELRATLGAVARVHVEAAVADYAVRLVRATRSAGGIGADGGGTEADGVALGASPRASMYLVRAARARAFLDGRSYATPHDVKRVALPVLRHRVVVTYEAEADGVRSEHVVRRVLDTVEAP